MNRPTGLRVEHREDALGITTSRPRLSWLLPKGCTRQTAYQLRVGDWDSGQVTGTDSILVSYGGPALRSGERVSWQVRVWTDQGVSEWSARQDIEVGLLHPSDWVAAWIEPLDTVPLPPAGSRPAYLLRHEFTLDETPLTARVHATAHGLYELFVNGVRVGTDELAPGFTSYRTNLHVQTYDITNLLTVGANVIGAVLSDGWYRGLNGMFRDFNAFGDRTALLAQVRVEDTNGARVIGTGDNWRFSTGGITSADLMAGQTTDLRREPQGWSSSGFDAADWRQVTVADHGFAGLIASPAPPVRAVEYRRPVSVTRAPSGRQVVDLGENVNGWVRLNRLGPAGTQTVLTYGEALDPAGEVTQANLVPAHLPPGLEVTAGQIDTVISAGRPGERFEPRHTVHGFRYVQVDGSPEVLTVDDVTGVVVNTDFRAVGSFECSDERINRLHQVAVRSFLGNACDVPTDCPTRERSAWTGDWQLFIPTASFLYDVAGFSDKWLRDLAADQWPNGIVPNYVPDPTGLATRDHPLLGRSQGSAGWGDAAIIVPWQVYLANGDVDLLARQWPSMVAWIERAIHMAKDGRHPDRAERRPNALPYEEFLWDTGFHFGEWLEPGVMISWDALFTADFSAVATAYLHLSSRLMAQIAGLIGDAAAAAHYTRIAGGTLLAWRAEFINDKGEISPDTQATLVRALAFNLVPDELRQQTARRLVDLIRKADNHLGTGFLATPYLLPMLADTGHLDVAYELLFQDTTPSWLGMINRGATTIWELWDGVDEHGVAHESLNHYSKGAVISFLHSHVAGIRLEEDGPAYRRFVVAPQPGGGITWARAVHESPYGTIESDWTLHDRTYQLSVLVPPGSTAQVVLPDGASADIGPGRSLFEWPAQINTAGGSSLRF